MNKLNGRPCEGEVTSTRTRLSVFCTAVTVTVLALFLCAGVCMMPVQHGPFAPDDAFAKSKSKAKAKIKLKAAGAKIVGIKSSYSYTGKRIEPRIKVYAKKKGKYVKLKKGKYYTVSYKNNKKAGTATLVVKGKKTYKGTLKKKFKIRYSLTLHGYTTVTYSAYEYDNGNDVKPKATVLYGNKKLVEGRDFTLAYRNCKALGMATVTAAGKGLYAGKASAEYDITDDVSRRMKVALSVTTYRYTGLPHVPDVTVTGKKPVEVPVEQDEQSAKPQVADDSDSSGQGGDSSQDASSDTQEPEQPSTKTVLVKTTLREGKDYKVKIKRNEDIGTATVTVTGKGRFKGSKTVKHFKIKEPTDKIIDVSFWEGDIDWDKVAPKVSTVFMRAYRTLSKHKKYSDRKKKGYLAADTRYDEYATACEKRGIPYSAYAYVIFTNAKDKKAKAIKDAKYQADRFWKAACSNGHKPVSLIIDAEDELMEKKHSSWVRTCTAAMIDRLQYRARQAGLKNGIKIGLYGGGYQFDLFGFYSKTGQRMIASKVDFLWIARYGTNNGKIPAAKWRPDEPYDVWQYTSTASIPGVDGNVDMSLLNPNGPNAHTIDWYLKR